MSSRKISSISKTGKLGSLFSRRFKRAKNHHDHEETPAAESEQISPLLSLVASSHTTTSVKKEDDDAERSSENQAEPNARTTSDNGIHSTDYTTQPPVLNHSQSLTTTEVKKQRRKGIIGTTKLAQVLRSIATESPTSSTQDKPPFADQAQSGLTPQLQNFTFQLPVHNASPHAAESSPVPQADWTIHGVKRKRGDVTLMTTSPYTLNTVHKKNFDVLSDGILLHPELTLHFAAWLDSRTLLSLYAISKDFHAIVNHRFITVMLNQASRKAPGASFIWPWLRYRQYCQIDPASSENGICLKPAPVSRAEYKAQADLVQRTPGRPRMVPTFRWLGLVLHRAKVIHTLYQVFAEHGVPLPPICRRTLYKIWFIFDIPDNYRRITYVHDPKHFSEEDLCLAITFIVRVDMVLHDPFGGEKRDQLRKLLFSSCDGFDMFLRVLRGQRVDGGVRDQVDMLQDWIAYGLQLTSVNGTSMAGSAFVPLQLTHRDLELSQSAFGIPRAQIGLLKQENWGNFSAQMAEKKLEPRYLMRIDQIMFRESVKRGLSMKGHYFKSILWGYVDPHTLQRTDKFDRTAFNPQLEEEFGLRDWVSDFRAPSKLEGGGPLDLAAHDQDDIDVISKVMSVKPKMSRCERQQRAQDAEMRRTVMKEWRAEMRKKEDLVKQRLRDASCNKQ